MAGPSERTPSHITHYELDDLSFTFAHLPGNRVSFHSDPNPDHRGTEGLTVIADLRTRSITLTGPSGYERELRVLTDIFSLCGETVGVNINLLNRVAEIRRSFADILSNQRPDRMEKAVRTVLSAVLFGLAGAMLFGVVVTGGFAGLNAAFRHSNVKDVVKQQIINLIAAAFTAVAHEMVFKMQAVLQKVFLQAPRRLPTAEAMNWQRVVEDLIGNEVGAVFIVGGIISAMAALPVTRGLALSLARENAQFFIGFAAWDVLKGLIADLIGGARSVISVDTREISESRLKILKDELMQIFRRRMRQNEMKLALL